MAKKIDNKAPSDLKAQYDELAAQCAAFDGQTIQLRRQRAEADKAWLRDRKKARSDLVARKGQVWQAWQAAIAAEPKPEAAPAA